MCVLRKFVFVLFALTLWKEYHALHDFFIFLKITVYFQYLSVLLCLAKVGVLGLLYNICFYNCVLVLKIRHC